MLISLAKKGVLYFITITILELLSFRTFTPGERFPMMLAKFGVDTAETEPVLEPTALFHVWWKGRGLIGILTSL